ncbi:hypothetical protein [Kribbella speibonae]|uniref:Right-handed parallel beta-helix repeat-containing protein n=1 Tax=Kribbella speibonae TaxID=1572660 RepID=A0A4R0IDN7_9ACTN|nr:hypothetical protein [Kribbella speibonae]TCC28908.1 hypothetical protein E0H92_42745 [Kribbella speibonae]
MNKPAAALTAALLLASATGVAYAAPDDPSTYYIDSAAGNDANAGTVDKPWKSLAKVNGSEFGPDDQILFKRGGSWTGTLELSSSGATDHPIVVGAYGSGALPKIGGPVLNCVHVTGSDIFIGDLRASGCNWAGFELVGDGIVMDTVQADNNVAGVSIVDGSDWNEIRWSTLVDNNKMSVNDTDPDNDSGAFGVLVNGDDNKIHHNTISGSFATSIDYTYDGAAVEIFNGDRNHIEYNKTANNDTFTELGHESGQTSDDNVFAYNSVTSNQPSGTFLITRGAQSNIGPVLRTLAINNSVNLPNGDGWSCDAGCGPDILKLRNNIVKVGKKVGYDDSFDTGNPADAADEDRGVYQGSVYQFTPGAHSVKADPLYTSATDLRLKAGSPAIGRAENSGYPYDLADKPLTTLTSWDSGAYQH